MSVKYHDNLVAGTPELATVVQAGNGKPVTSGAVKSAISAATTDLVDTKDKTLTFSGTSFVRFDQSDILRTGKVIDDVESLFCYELYGSTPFWCAITGGDYKITVLSNVERTGTFYFRFVIRYKG